MEVMERLGDLTITEKAGMSDFLIKFDDKGKVIGELIIRKGKLHFEGKADKSAKLLFEEFKGLVDVYIKSKSKGEISEAKTR